MRSLHNNSDAGSPTAVGQSNRLEAVDKSAGGADEEELDSTFVFIAAKTDPTQMQARHDRRERTSRAR
jgi:hypothetical protein